jgi:peptidoglycan-N-acetylglucosamine deacetylase
MMRFHRAPFFLPYFNPSLTWSFKNKSPSLFLTFDDGPNPDSLPFILKTLSDYKALATFFCVGDNVRKYKSLYQEILSAGHETGNHTFHHLNARKCAEKDYLESIRQCKEHVDSQLFRPPYSRLPYAFAKNIRKDGFNIVMWSLITYDFDPKLSPARIIKKCANKIKGGDIIVMHDHPKAMKNLSIILPELLEIWSEGKFRFEKIPQNP